MTKEEKLTEEINFADQGAGSYLCCSLWDMMEDHDATLEDFEHNTKTWRVAVELSACEEYQHTRYKDLWEKIICTSFVEREEHNSTAKETAEKIKEYLIGKAIDGTLDLDFNNLDFSHLIGDGLQFDRKGNLEQGCGKEDCCQSELSL